VERWKTGGEDESRRLGIWKGKKGGEFHLPTRLMATTRKKTFNHHDGKSGKNKISQLKKMSQRLPEKKKGWNTTKWESEKESC